MYSIAVDVATGLIRFWQGVGSGLVRVKSFSTSLKHQKSNQEIKSKSKAQYKMNPLR